MWPVWVGVAGLVLAACAAAWPLVVKAQAGGLDRAGWVNRLFDLATTAEAMNEADVAAAARALISALVDDKAPKSKA